jgi:hypothetical protein
MTVETDIENLGVPDVEIGGLQIWTHSRRYPESQNFWDVNWLNSTFLCKARGASVWVSGDILHNTEIADWLTALEGLNSTLPNETYLPSSDEAHLLTMENYVNVKILPRTYQRVSIEVNISPDRTSQQHYFEFWASQNCLNDIIASCRKVLTKFPIKGEKP